MISSVSCVSSLPTSPYQTFLSRMSSFATPYIRNDKVVESPREINLVVEFDPSNVRQPSTAEHFHPDVWKDYHFGSSTRRNMDPGVLEEKKNEVKAILSLASSDPFQEQDLVDKIQRLGIAYQFQVEIQEILNRTYINDYNSYYDKHIEDGCADLHFVSLRFRLLRQAGYYVSPAVFSKFKDENGKFSVTLVHDVPGMLSLYEASYLGFNGEDIMDDALTFSTNHLQSIVGDLTSPLASQVRHALHRPLHHWAERVLAIEYIKMYGDDITQNKTLLEYAKLDYNSVQLLHQKEINELSRWWKQIDINSRVPFHVRDRVVEAYIIINSIYEPEFSLGRIHLTKLWCVLTILDDAHDVYGNIPELELLCEALQSWEDADLNKLPHNIKEVFCEITSLFNDLEADMKRKGNFIGGPYLKKQIQILAKAYIEEAKILFLKNLPKEGNWSQLSLVTIGWYPFIVAAAMNMGELGTKEVFDWIDSTPTIIKCSYFIGRLLDEMGTYTVEEERGIFNTFLTCYMKEHGVSRSEATKNFQTMCMRLWKDMNQECLRINNPAPIGLYKFILGITRNMVLYYEHGDGYSNSSGHTKEIVTSMLIESFPV